jgi:two-component system NtrC family sensor kinase
VQTQTSTLGPVPHGREVTTRNGTEDGTESGADRGGIAFSLRFKMLSGLAILLFISLLAAAYITVLWLPIIGPSADLAAIVVTLAAVYAFVLVLTGDYLLSRLVVRPVEEVVKGVERIAAGDESFELSGAGSREMRRLATSVNAMTAKLMRNQQTLARNVRSLNETNRALTETRAELIQAEKLATVGMLAAGVAHEIGNPLGAIMGYVELARRDGAGEDGWTDDIRAEAVRIDRIIRGLLDYARPRGASPRPLNVRDTIDRTVQLLELQGRLKGIQLDVQVGSGMPRVHADPTHLQQVLVNLLLNASDAIEGVENPHIRIDATLTVYEASEGRRAPRRASDPEGVDYSHLRRLQELSNGAPRRTILPGATVVKVTIADNGPGIAESEGSRVFEPFFTTKEPGRGTGLGLAVSARLVEAMNGVIQIEPGTGRGAAFSVMLPISTDMEES